MPISLGIIFLLLWRSTHNIPPIPEEGKLMNIGCPPNTLQIFSECLQCSIFYFFISADSAFGKLAN
jgi:hypothetical protein